MSGLPPLRPLHAESLLNRVKLATFEKFTIDTLRQSLAPGQEHCLKVRPDGTMLDGHHRIRVLKDRGEDVNALPREVIQREGTVQNPYGKYLGDQDPMSVLSTTVDRITELIGGMSAAELAEPLAPGKWSIHETIAHLADLEMVTSTRCRWILFEDKPPLLSYNQDPWVDGWRREEEPFGETLARLRVLRNAQLRLFRKCSEADLARVGTHSELGEVSVGFLRSLVAGHDLNHLLQLESVASR